MSSESQRFAEWFEKQRRESFDRLSDYGQFEDHPKWGLAAFGDMHKAWMARASVDDRIVSELRAQLEEARADAERWRWAVKHAAWLRHEHCAYVAIPVALDADLSCVAMRRAAVDAEIARTGGTKDD